MFMRHVSCKQRGMHPGRLLRKIIHRNESAHTRAHTHKPHTQIFCPWGLLRKQQHDIWKPKEGLGDPKCGFIRTCNKFTSLNLIWKPQNLTRKTIMIRKAALNKVRIHGMIRKRLIEGNTWLGTQKLWQPSMNQKSKSVSDSKRRIGKFSRPLSPLQMCPGLTRSPGRGMLIISHLCRFSGAGDRIVNRGELSCESLDSMLFAAWDSVEEARGFVF